KILAPHVLQPHPRGMLSHSQRTRRSQKGTCEVERRVLVRLVEYGHVAAKRQPLDDRNLRHDLYPLHIHARGVARLRAECTTRWIGLAWHRDDQIVHPAREISGGDRRPLAETGGEARVVLARCFGLEIRIAEAGEVQLVER